MVGKRKEKDFKSKSRRLEAKLVTSRRARAIVVLSGFSKNNGLFQRALRGKFSRYICWHSYLVFPGDSGNGGGGKSLDNNKLVHANSFFYLCVLVPRNSKLEANHWQFSMRFEKLDIAQTNFYNSYRLFFHQEQYCPEQEYLKENGLKYSFMWEAREDL